MLLPKIVTFQNIILYKRYLKYDKLLIMYFKSNKSVMLSINVIVLVISALMYLLLPGFGQQGS